MERKLIKIYHNRAVFLDRNYSIVYETIDDKALEILNYYEKLKKYNLLLDNI